MGTCNQWQAPRTGCGGFFGPLRFMAFLLVESSRSSPGLRAKGKPTGGRARGRRESQLAIETAVLRARWLIAAPSPNHSPFRRESADRPRSWDRYSVTAL